MVLLMKTSMLRFFCLPVLGSLLLTHMQGQTPAKTFRKVVSQYEIGAGDDFLRRIEEVNRDIAARGVVLYEPDGRKLLTGYAYHEMYDWDLYFENLYMSYFGISDYCFTNLKSFLNQQCVNGFISRTLIEKRERQHFKPFLAQIAELGSRQTGDYAWLEERGDRGRMQIGPAFKSVSYYEQLMLSIDYWMRYCDFDRNGLPVWNSSDHSGMDNQISRAGRLDEFRYEGVDLACYIYRELRAMELMAEKLGKAEDAKRFRVRAALLADKINTVFWDEEDGFYYDRDEHPGEPVRVKSAAGFIPLWAGIVPPRRAERLVREHLTDPDEFWTEFPVACYAKTEPDYVQGDIRDWGCNWRGTTWIPINYMIMHGLLDYGYADVARELARKTVDLVYKRNEVTREFYDGESGEGLGLKRFWGWSVLAYVMPFECETGYDPSKLDGSAVRPLGRELFGLDFPASDDPRPISTHLSQDGLQ